MRWPNYREAGTHEHDLRRPLSGGSRESYPSIFLLIESKLGRVAHGVCGTIALLGDGGWDTAMTPLISFMKSCRCSTCWLRGIYAQKMLIDVRPCYPTRQPNHDSFPSLPPFPSHFGDTEKPQSYVRQHRGI